MNICAQCRYRGQELQCPRDGLPMLDEGLAPADSPDLIGQIIADRYEIESELGSGAMGWVFRARHLMMDQVVALKVLRHNASQDLDAVARFYREARATSSLRQPHTVRVADFGSTESGALFLAMEYLEGIGLRDLVHDEAPIAPERIVHIARQICNSLDEAHERGIVHRDLKPDNVFLIAAHRESDFVKVIDFGIAKFVEGESAKEKLTRAGEVVGTPQYMSPEQAQASTIDRRSDVYALGIIIYEMLIGQVPFDADTVGAVLRMQMTVPVPPLPDRAGDHEVPQSLRDLVYSMLEKSPDDRPGTAAEVGDLLGACLSEMHGVPDGGHVIALPPSDRSLGASSSDDGETDEIAAVIGSTVARLNWGWLTAGALAAALVVSIVLQSGGGSDVDVPPTGPRTIAPFELVAQSEASTSSDTGPVQFAALSGADASIADHDVSATDVAGSSAGRPDARTAGIEVASQPSNTALSGADSTSGSTELAAIVRTVMIRTNPAGARVYEGAQELGQTPLEIEVKTDQSRIVRLRRSGYKPMTKTISSSDAPDFRVKLQPKKKADIEMKVL